MRMMPLKFINMQSAIKIYGDEMVSGKNIENQE